MAEVNFDQACQAKALFQICSFAPCPIAHARFASFLAHFSRSIMSFASAFCAFLCSIRFALSSFVSMFMSFFVLILFPSHHNINLDFAGIENDLFRVGRDILELG